MARPNPWPFSAASAASLARQAKIQHEEVEENNLGSKAKHASFHRWDTCSLCEQNYHGVVACALGWACWKTYVRRPEDLIRIYAMMELGNGLFEGKHYEAALPVYEAALDAEHRYGSSEENILCTRINIARCLTKLRRLEESVAIQREVYAREKVLLGPTNVGTLTTALNLTYSLNRLEQYVESKALARKLVPVCRRALGSEHDITLGFYANFAEALDSDARASRADILQAVALLEDVVRAYRRVFGAHHPETVTALSLLEYARKKREDVAV